MIWQNDIQRGLKTDKKKNCTCFNLEKEQDRDKLTNNFPYKSYLCVNNPYKKGN